MSYSFIPRFNFVSLNFFNSSIARDDREIGCYYIFFFSEKEDYNPKFQITKEQSIRYSRYLPLNCVHLNDNIRRIREPFITSPYNTSINKRVVPRHKGCF